MPHLFGHKNITGMDISEDTDPESGVTVGLP
jgi:hypothetical protein